jgi:hypothetical protein
MLAPVSESFVDLSYRGLPLGRRIKLTQVRPSSAYLELATPMPVGTAIVIATDEGVSLDATVTHVFEQIGGSDRVPGMTVAPALAEAAGAAWWKARVALPDLASKTEQPAPPPRSRPLTLRPRSATTQPPASDPAASPAAAPAPAPAPRPQPAEILREPELVDDGKKTVMMSAVVVDAEPTDPHAEAPILDDGKRTVMMHSVDLSALGLEPTANSDPGASGELAATDDDDGDGDGDGAEGAEEPEARAGANGDPRGPVPAPPTGVFDKKPSGKKRKKRR